MVDSFSTDRTVEIARGPGRDRPAEQVRQLRQAVPVGARPRTDHACWIMRLDADEVIEPDLADRSPTNCRRLPADVAGINLKRKHIFMGRWIRHGGRYPLRLLRIWRRGQGRIEDRWMDEHVIVWGGRTVTFDGGFADHNLNDLTFFTDKHNKYATREAIDVLNQRCRLFRREDAVTAEGSRQAAVKRWVKERSTTGCRFSSARRLFPLPLVFQLGFLDGKAA